MAAKPDQQTKKQADELNQEAPPQENTAVETGVPKAPQNNRDSKMLRDELDLYTSTSPSLTGGDLDAAWEQADAVGDEAVGGTVATPDQNVTEELEKAVGLEMDDRAFLRTNEILEQRDDRRWELDPTSSEDYSDRRE